MRRPYQIQFRERAKGHLVEAQAWLLTNGGAGQVNELMRELGTALRRIERHPKMYALVAGSKSIRRLRLTRTGYHVYYRVFDTREQILVTRIRHQRRRPVRF